MKNCISTQGLANLANLAKHTLAETSRGSSGSAEPEGSLSTSTNPSLPFWCLRSCQNLDILDLPDGLVAGCVQEHPDWLEVWKRLSSMSRCPLK